MRALFVFATLALGSASTLAQAQNPGTKRPAADSGRDTAQLSREIAQQRAAGEKYLPDAERFTFGERAISANTRVDGPIAVAHGNLDVYGTVDGDVVALGGDVRVHKGARVTGDAWAAGGKVLIEGGSVDGGKRSIEGMPTIPGAAEQPRHPRTTWDSVKLVLGWFALFAIIGLGVMIFTEANLDGVVIALERGFARSFWIGLAGEVLMLPALLVLVVALAITILGALLIPFAIVAYVIAAAGLFTLGFLAVARLTGRAMTSDRGTTTPRGVHVRALMIGLVVYGAIWMLAAAFTWSPVFGAILRAVAIAITWVAATVGLGATIVSRAGTQRASVGGSRPTSTDELAWQTPTPVTGVAASSRRPVSTAR
jgi:hypothetical protein